MISTLIPPSRPGRSPISPRIRVRIRPQFSGHRYGSVAGGAQQQTRLDDAGAGEEALAQEALVSLGHTLAPQIGDQDREEHPTEAVQRTELLHPPDYECRDIYSPCARGALCADPHKANNFPRPAPDSRGVLFELQLEASIAALHGDQVPERRKPLLELGGMCAVARTTGERCYRLSLAS